MRRQGRWLAALGAVLALLAPARADGPWFVRDPLHDNPNCPPGFYSALHYWTPGLYFLRARCRPSHLDQYPPGPCPPVGPSYRITRYPCPTTPPAPSAPYADPADYYGRPPATTPPPTEALSLPGPTPTPLKP